MEFKVTFSKYTGLRVMFRIGYKALELRLGVKRYLTWEEKRANERNRFEGPKVERILNA